MTYCIALRLDTGLVFLSDTRTNAGVDNISSYRKMHVLIDEPDRLLVLQSAGSLATTHEVLDRIEADLRRSRAGAELTSLATVEDLSQAALYVGRLNREVTESHAAALPSGTAGATFILGGQIGEEDADILLVYSEGNYIRASRDKPYLQIGESKYGKFLLDLGVRDDTPLETATKIAVASMISTARANLSVGPPYDLGVYIPDGYLLQHFRIEARSTMLAELGALWERHVREAFADLPRVAMDLEPLPEEA